MDGSRFDTLTRRFAAPASRRRVLAGIAGGFAATIAVRRVTDAGGLQQTACADFCDQIFSAGAERDACYQDAVKNRGLCIACVADPKRVCKDANGLASCPDLGEAGPYTACACTSNADCPGDGCHIGLCGPETHLCSSVPIENPEKDRFCVVCSADADCDGGPCCDGRCCPSGATCQKNDAGTSTCCLTCGDHDHGSCCDEITIDERGGFAIELAACFPSADASDTRDYCCNEVYTLVEGKPICYGPVGSVR
jgi:hypothetical protein